MAYGDQSEYVKHNSGCDNGDCGSDCSCSSNSCECCPVGTVSVKDSCGNHVGCLTPSDAAQYYEDTLDITDGYIKVIDTDGNYVGLLTPTEYCEYLTCVGSIASAGFNVITGNENLVTLSVLGGTSTTGSSNQVIVDRFGINGDINVSVIMTGMSGISLVGTSKVIDSSGNTITSLNGVISEDSSLLIYQISYDGTATAAGTYNGVIKFSSGGVDRYAKLTVTVS